MARMDPLLRHAITPPVFNGGKIHRERLVDGIHANIPRKLVVVAGPLAEEGLCENGLLLSECQDDACTWHKGELCSDIDCPANHAAIPTVTDWGLLVMTILLLIAAKVRFGRRAGHLQTTTGRTVVGSDGAES